ncbi:MAG: peptidase M22 [Firmicutes bacterium]|nr:peptidase M22 [Bacillota bacterium]
MSCVLGIDTSNYTTSAALYDSESNAMLQQKMLLPVREGALGLKQSDAVFHHTQQLPQVLKKLFAGTGRKPDAVSVSVRPRDQEGSYMPCFTVGAGTASAIASAFSLPLTECSHQHGHLAAALYSCGKLEWVHRRFLAFHVSGGTTDALLVEPDAEKVFSPHLAASSLDLKAGQAVDRVGVMLGLRFPAGRELDRLARQSTAEFRIRPTLRGCDCSLSGIENQCKKMQQQGEAPADIAKFCIESVCAALDMMTERLLQKYGKLPLVFAGGVMSNSIISARLGEKYGASFAAPEFSCDNAAGVALLGWMKLDP